MKTIIKITFSFIFIAFNGVGQSVGINSNGAAPDNSALLDLNSTDKGFLITRADTLSINSPAFGLMTLSPIDSCLYLYNGINWTGMGGAGVDCFCGISTSSEPPSEPLCKDSVTQVVDVTTATGKVWMDRNLGASQVATTSTDAAAYGDLYQWGRCFDGHQKRTSGTTTTLSTTDTPGHNNFIRGQSGTYDWRDGQNDNLWQGEPGINNPCPKGYRLPTFPELEAESATWATQDPAGAFNSPLRMTLAGRRVYFSGTVNSVSSFGYYWSSTFQVTPNNNVSRHLRIHSSGINPGGIVRSSGNSVRCIKD